VMLYVYAMCIGTSKGTVNTQSVIGYRLLENLKKRRKNAELPR
jgi:hypothetical protein